MVTSKLSRFFSRGLAAGFVALCGALSSGPASATNPDHVSFTLEGCRNTGNVPLSATTGGVLLCPNGAYTTGNLGKGWNELDLVPMRITAQAGSSAPATQTYTIAAVVDYIDGNPSVYGYDFITPTFVLNASKSTAGCNTPVISAGQRGTEALPGLGGITESLYRTMTLTQTKGTTCVYDYNARLALGSHNFPGSSLHVNLALVDPNAPGGITTSGIGARDVSIPVKEILPQQVSKTMMATQNTDSSWSISKSPDPANVLFGDVCAANAPTSQPVKITVTWTKTPAAAGAVNVTTRITLTNPAARAVLATVTDKIYNGSDQSTPPLDTKTYNQTLVPANSSVVLDSHTVALASTAGPILNDVATATYVDATFPDVAIPGTTVAMASTTVAAGLAANTSAIVTDTESLSGTGLTFAVASPSIIGFDNYTANTATTGPVKWTTSVPQVAGGSVVFTKTIYLDKPRVTAGKLDDTAGLGLFNSDGTPGTAVGTASLSVGVSAEANVKLDISKTIPGDLSLGTGRIVVAFTIGRSGSSSTQPRTITFYAGETTKTLAVGDLISGPPDLYTVTEDSATFFVDSSDNVGKPSGLVPSGGNQKSVDLRLDASDAVTSCTGTAYFTNIPATSSYAHAQVKKTTVPVIGSGDPDYNWEFKLYDPSNTLIGTLSNVGANAAIPEYTGFVDGSNNPLDLTVQGKYVVKEAPKSGWDVTSVTVRDGATNDCTFTVSYPADTGALKSCSFTNTKRGVARVVKTVSGSTSALDQFVFQIRTGASVTQAGTVYDSITFGNTGGTQTFTKTLTPGAAYQLCEVVLPGWLTTLGPPLYTVFNPSGDNSVVCTDFTVAAGVTKTFNVTNSRPGGYARTIGFWKNWSSCGNSNGKQRPVLDQTLGLGDIYIGLYLLHDSNANADVASDCLAAVRLLSKSDVVSGASKSSDPAFNLAAQLLAAKLNIQAGAGACIAAATAITKGQDILDGGATPPNAVNFNGTGSYTKSATFGTDANQIASQLDSYNNNKLCP